MTWINSLLTLVGVIVGASASYFTATKMDRSRWHRELDSRWDADRRKAYTEYAAAVNRLVTQHGRIAAARGIKNDFLPTDLEGAFAQLVKFASERSAAWESVLLLGAPDTIQAGRRWHAAIFAMEPFASGDNNDQSAWAQYYKHAGECRDHFYEVARADLGVQGGFPHHNGGPIE